MTVGMGTTDFHSQMPPIPGDDGAIQEALADLDRKIDAWSDELQRAHRVLRELGAQAASGTPSSASPAASPIADPTPPPAGSVVKLPPKDDRPKPDPTPEQAAPTEDPPAAPPVVEVTAPLQETPAEEPPAAGKNDEDEALLATLSPAKARAIRIKRRLCNGAKSVRELLEEG